MPSAARSGREGGGPGGPEMWSARCGGVDARAARLGPARAASPQRQQSKCTTSHSETPFSLITPFPGAAGVHATAAPLISATGRPRVQQWSPLKLSTDGWLGLTGDAVVLFDLDWAPFLLCA